MFDMTEKLVRWIEQERKARFWSIRELARQSGLSSGMISDVLNSRVEPKEKACRRIARAFGVAPEFVFRLAGLLDEVDVDKQQTEELLHYFKQLSLAERINLIRAARAWTHSDRDVETGTVGIVPARE